MSSCSRALLNLSPWAAASRLFLVISAGAIAATASADLQTVSKVTFKVATQPASGFTGDAPTPPMIPPTTVTSFYKGGNARAEIDPGTVTIYLGKEGKVYTIDTGQKTYYVQTVKEFLDPRPDPFSGRTGPMKESSDVTLKPGDGARTCAGMDAKVFVLTGTVTVTPQRSGGSGGGGGGLLGGFGRRGRGGGGGGGGGRSNFMAKKVEVSGEYWLSDKLKLPNDKNASPLASIFSPAPMQNFVFRPVSDNLLKTKDLPLDSRLTVTSTESDGSQKSVTRTSEVVSIDQRPIPDSLFEIPVGYTQIAPPNNP